MPNQRKQSECYSLSQESSDSTSLGSSRSFDNMSSRENSPHNNQPSAADIGLSQLGFASGQNDIPTSSLQMRGNVNLIQPGILQQLAHLREERLQLERQTHQQTGSLMQVHQYLPMLTQRPRVPAGQASLPEQQAVARIGCFNECGRTCQGCGSFYHFCGGLNDSFCVNCAYRLEFAPSNDYSRFGNLLAGVLPPDAYLANLLQDLRVTPSPQIHLGAGVTQPQIRTQGNMVDVERRPRMIRNRQHLGSNQQDGQQLTNQMALLVPQQPTNEQRVERDVFAGVDHFDPNVVEGYVPPRRRSPPASRRDSRVNRTKISPILRFGQYGKDRGQFVEPSGICTDSVGNIYVVDSNNRRINIYDPQGDIVRHIDAVVTREPSQSGNSGVMFANRIAICKRTANIVITERSPTKLVKVISPQGHLIRKFGSNIIQHPRGIAVDHNGYVYVLESHIHRIVIFTSEGIVAKHINLIGFEFPFSIDVNDQCEIFVADNKAHYVIVYDSNGNILRRIGGPGVTNFPVGINIGARGEVIVSDNHNNFNITVFDRFGEPITALESQNKHTQCYDVNLTHDYCVILTTKDYEVCKYQIPIELLDRNNRYQFWVQENSNNGNGDNNNNGSNDNGGNNQRRSDRHDKRDRSAGSDRRSMEGAIVEGVPSTYGHEEVPRGACGGLVEQQGACVGNGPLTELQGACGGYNPEEDQYVQWRVSSSMTPQQPVWPPRQHSETVFDMFDGIGNIQTSLAGLTNVGLPQDSVYPSGIRPLLSCRAPGGPISSTAHSNPNPNTTTVLRNHFAHQERQRLLLQANQSKYSE